MESFLNLIANGNSDSLDFIDLAYFEGFPDSVDLELNSMELGDEADIQGLVGEHISFDAVTCSNITAIAITTTIIAIADDGCSFSSVIANTTEGVMASIDSVAGDMVSDLESNCFRRS